MGSVVEKKVCARLEISGSNPVYANVHISLKKLYLDSRRACGGGRLARIFFLQIDFYGRAPYPSYKLIFSCEK